MELYGQIFDENNINEVFKIVSNHKSCVKENVFKKYFIKLYNDLNIIDFPNGFTFAQKLYHFLRNDINLQLGLCKTCGKRTHFLGFTKGYRTYCNANCMGKNQEFWDKHKQTNLEKYGCEYSVQSDMIKEKTKKTMLEKYGCEYSFQSDMVKEKTKKTMLEKYGCESFNNSDKISESLLSKSKSEWNEIVNKREQTYKEKTGYNNPFQNPSIINEFRQTNLEKYGYEIASKNDDIRKKISNSKLSFDDEKNKSINEKREKTCMEIYGKSHISQVDSIKEKISTTRKNNTLQKYDGVKNIEDNRIFTCNCTDYNCNLCENKEFIINRCLYLRRKYNNEELCTIKNPINYSSSNEEKEFGKFIESVYTDEIKYNDRNILSGKEIDIYIPKLNIGFEFNGIYFHSELHKSKTYHQDKVLLAKSKGIQLIQVWEDDWFNKRDIIESIIKSKLGIYQQKIGARKCEIKEVSSADAKDFINDNHLQGYVNSSIRIGLYYQDELVEIITFGKLRKIMNSVSVDNEYELYRFCSKRGIQVIGGFNKLLQYFIKKYSPKRIITYASLEISNGNVYSKCGFNYVKTTTVGYSWANSSTENKYLYNHRKHRFNFRKSELVKLGYDKSKSEDEIMHERGYFKCYNSGNLFFEMVL